MTVSTRKVIFAAVIAAIYAAFTLALSPISFGTLQFRVAEILTILPFYFPPAVPGLFIGCLLANIISPYGPLDMLLGSTATLIAAYITMRIGKTKNKDKIPVKALACLPPVLINALFIGLLLTYYIADPDNKSAFIAAFAYNALSVGICQFAVICFVGLPLLIYLPKTGVIDALNRLFL